MTFIDLQGYTQLNQSNIKWVGKERNNFIGAEKHEYKKQTL